MRLSIDPTDAGFKSYQDLKLSGANVRIYLDGEVQNDVLTVDSEEGWMVRYVKIGPTHYVVKGDCLVTELVKGSVVIEMAKSSALN